MKVTVVLAALSLTGTAFAAKRDAPTSSPSFTCVLQFASGGSSTLTGTSPNGGCNPLPSTEECTGVMLSPGDTGAATIQLFSDSACKTQIINQPANSMGTFTAQKVGSYCVNM